MRIGSKCGCDRTGPDSTLCLRSSPARGGGRWGRAVGLALRSARARLPVQTKVSGPDPRKPIRALAADHGMVDHRRRRFHPRRANRSRPPTTGQTPFCHKRPTNQDQFSTPLGSCGCSAEGRRESCRGDMAWPNCNCRVAHPTTAGPPVQSKVSGPGSGSALAFPGRRSVEKLSTTPPTQLLSWSLLRESNAFARVLKEFVDQQDILWERLAAPPKSPSDRLPAINSSVPPGCGLRSE